MQTIIGLNDAKAVKRWSAVLMVDVGRESYFSKKFTGRGEDSPTPLQLLTNLEKEAGEQISYDLRYQLKKEPVEGDNPLAGKEENLKFSTDTVFIDQARSGVDTGGRMTRKRTLHDLRKIARTAQKEYWARVFDELWFMYLSGARGINPDYIFNTGYTGRANNAFAAPDSDHIIYGDGTSKATLTTAGKMSLSVIEKAKNKAQVMGGGTQEIAEMQPVRIDGEEHFCLVMHSHQEYDLRTNSSTGQWQDIQKAIATSDGRANPMIKGGLGMYNNVILHSHKAVIRFDDYGAGSNVDAARALFMGRQAGVIAFGSPGSGMRFDWHEEEEDRGNRAVITTGAIFGQKKCRFASKDFGLIAVDTAAADPNA